MPGYILFALLMLLLQEIIKPEQLDQLQREPGSAKCFFVFNANGVGVDFNPLGLKFVIVEKFRLHKFRLAFAFGDFGDAFAFWFFELAQVRNNTLAWPSLGPIRLDQSPVGEFFPVRLFVARSDEHVRILS